MAPAEAKEAKKSRAEKVNHYDSCILRITIFDRKRLLIFYQVTNIIGSILG
jgi:hypothetical protein